MECHAVLSKMTQVHLVWLHYIYWYWFFCHLADFLLNNPPVLKSSSTLETSWTWEALVIYCVGVKSVWSCGLQFIKCSSVLVADAISYGFPLGKRFSSSFCSKFSGKRERHSVHMECSPPPEPPTLLQIFFFFYTLHYLLFIDEVFFTFSI